MTMELNKVPTPGKYGAPAPKSVPNHWLCRNANSL